MAKKESKNKRVVKMNELYEGAEAKNRTCPKCGKGVFLADHGKRLHCGKCGYTEFKK